MAARSSVIKVSLLGDASKLKDAFREAEVSGEGWAQKMATVGGNIIGTFIDVAKKVAISVLAIGTAIAAIAIKGGIERALDTEDAITQMRRLGLTTEEVEAAVGAVDRAFDGTIFTNPAGFALFGRLQGLGEELDSIPGTIGLIADMAAFGNTPLEQMGSIIERIISNGKLSGEEINRLADAGIPLAALADALGLSLPALREMASDGEITSDMFLEAANSMGIFEGAAKSAGDTTRGAWTNTLSQLRRLGELVVGPLFGENGPMVTLFKAMRQALIDFRPYAITAGEALGDFLIPKIEALSAWLTSGGLPVLIERIADKFRVWKDKLAELWPYVERGVGYVRDLFDRLKAGENPLQGVTTGFLLLGGPLMLLVRELLPALLPVLEAILTPMTEMANEAAPALAEIFGVLVTTLLPPLVAMLEGLADVLSQNPEFVWAIVGAFLAFKTIMFVVGVIQAIQSAFAVLTAVMAFNPFILLAVAIVALAILIYKNWDEIVAFLSGAWQWIKDTAATVGTWLKDKFFEAVEFVANLFLNWSLLGLLVTHWQTIKTGVLAVVDYFKEKWDDLVEWFTAIPGRVTEALATIWDTVKEVALTFKGWLLDRWDEIVGFVSELPGRITAAAVGLWDGIVTSFKKAINTIIAAWNGLRFSIGGQRVELPFGMGFDIPTITLTTPQIPYLHTGGVFRAPAGGQGLAMLKDRERVLAPGQSGSIIQLIVPSSRSRAIDGWDIIEALQKVQAQSGPLPIEVRVA